MIASRIVSKAVITSYSIHYTKLYELDDSLPLTTMEYNEWGNPNDKQAFDYMLSYSPYDNVAQQSYPNMLIVAGLNDPLV